MSGFSSSLASIWRVYRHGRTSKFTVGLPSERLPCVFNSCFHHLSLLTSKPLHKMADAHLIAAKFTVAFRSNYASIMWYSSEPSPRSRTCRRINTRYRLPRRPTLDKIRFNQAVAQLPARFTADDLHTALAFEDDPLVCLELFNWASRQHRFKHSVHTFQKTIQKLGIYKMTKQMSDVVDQVLDLPHFGSETLYNTIIYYYSKARMVSRAARVFKHMQKVKNPDCRPSLKTYNLMLCTLLSRKSNTYVNHMYMATLESVFRQMIIDGIEPNIFSLNSMIEGYVLSNHVNDALRVFYQMGVVYSTVPDSLTYDHIIYGLCVQSRANNATKLFTQMKEKGLVASAKTYNSLVNALSMVGEAEEAVKYLLEMTERQISVDFITYKTLLDELCRNGRTVEASNLVKELKKKRLISGITFEKLLAVLEDDFTEGNSRLSRSYLR